jgi:monoamine oxidase
MDADTSLPGRSLIIIGAGLAGLTVAYELIRAEYEASTTKDAIATQPSSFRITILEARDRIGGRLLSLPDVDTDAASSGKALSADSPASFNCSLDLGASWHWPPHHSSIVALIRKLGLESFQGPDSRRMGGGWRVRGGNQRIAEALWAEIQRMAAPGSVELKLGCVCTCINAAKDDSHVTVDTLISDSFHAVTGVVITVPPRLALAYLSFSPLLPVSTQAHLQEVPTWMGSSCKIIVRFEEPFWNEKGLPDEQRGGSRAGNAVLEWHDASSAFETERGTSVRVHALLGFTHPGITPSQVAAQLQRTYAPIGFMPPSWISFHVADWSADPYTSASTRDGEGGHPCAHPHIRQSLWPHTGTGGPLLLLAVLRYPRLRAGTWKGR